MLTATIFPLHKNKERVSSVARIAISIYNSSLLFFLVGLYERFEILWKMNDILLNLFRELLLEKESVGNKTNGRKPPETLLILKNQSIYLDFMTAWIIIEWLKSENKLFLFTM